MSIKKRLQEKRKQKIRMIVVIVVAACVAVGLISYLIYYRWNLRRQESAYRELRETETTERLQESAKETATEEQEPEICQSLYDFTELRETNEDIYAWINVPGTQVDYPILQNVEDNYYLDRNIDHSKGYPACIYTNKCNVKDFSDSLTVVYGHNMKNNSMFGSLKDYESEQFFEENRNIYVYTDEKRLTYEIYAAVKFTDDYLSSVYGTNSKAGNGQFLEALEENARQYSAVSHLAEMEVLPEDKLLVLSTCIANEDEKRYLIVGVLVEEAYYGE